MPKGNDDRSNRAGPVDPDWRYRQYGEIPPHEPKPTGLHPALIVFATITVAFVVAVVAVVA